MSRVEQSGKLTDSRLRFTEDLEILNPALPVAYSRRDGWAEVKNVRSSGMLSWAKFKKCLGQRFLESLGDEVDRIVIFLDASQSIALRAIRYPAAMVGSIV
jgi:hypothetical protein